MGCAAAARLARFATWRGRLSAPRFWSSAWSKGGWIRLLSGATFRPSTLELGGDEPISSSGAIRASLFPSLGFAEELTTNATCGRKSSGSSSTPELRSCSSRTSPVISGSDSTRSSRTLPRSGSMRSGTCFPRARSEHRTDVRGCSLWPTAATTDSSSSARHTTKAGNMHAGTSLTDAARAWPTPTAHDGRRPGPDLKSTQGGNLARDAALWSTPDSGVFNDGESLESFERRREELRIKGYNGNGAGTPLAVQVKGWNSPDSPRSETISRAGDNGSPAAVLHPSFVEALMGFPIGWTDFGRLGTLSFRKSPRSRGANFQRELWTDSADPERCTCTDEDDGTCPYCSWSSS